MTNEEAIERTEWCISKNKEYIQKTIKRGFTAGEVQETLEYYECILAALKCANTTGEPLTLNQLRKMDGQPVWVVESPDWGHWELSEDAEDYLCDRDTDLYGLTYPDPDGKAGLHKLGWLAYAYPPAHIDRESWEKPCDMCRGKTTLYQHTNSTKLFMNTFGKAAALVTECMACPPYADCCMKGISSNSVFKINFCPECGRPLTSEAWDMLEKRLRG